MKPPAEGPPHISGAVRVSTLELFFDLVFVFILTQLAETFYRDFTLAGLADTVLILALVWWMYSGYAWLTNAIAPSSTTRRTLLLGGMAGFLLMAIAAPAPLVLGLGLGYLLVNVVHTLLFRLAALGGRRALRTVIALNTLASALVLAGAFVPDPWRRLCWAVVLLVQIATGLRNRAGLRLIAAGHFAERHGLVIIVALGESIIALGLGFAGVRLGVGEILTALLGLTIAYYLWWFYFAADDSRAAHVLARARPVRRAGLALFGYGYALFPMLLGIVVLATGFHQSVGHAFEPLHTSEALALAGGVSLYLAGHGVFLALFGLRGVWLRFGAAAIVLATVPLGHQMAIFQLAAIPLVLTATAITEDLPAVRWSGSTAIGEFGRTG